MRVIYEQKEYRIIEEEDESYDYENLAGDCYCPKTNSDIDKAELKRQENEFKRLINNEGVYGYTLQKWNHDINKGWEFVDSCWGFVGQYTPNEEIFNHYIVEELKGKIGK